MSIDYNALRVRIRPDKIARNFELIKSRCASPIPVIKADAYGHGLTICAQALKKAGAARFAAGTVEEAAGLCHISDTPPISLLGPVREHDYRLIAETGVIPFIYTFEQLRKLKESAIRKISISSPAATANFAHTQSNLTDSRTRFVLKFNTGMNRLGFESGDIPEILRLLEDSKELLPVMAASHLSSADVPEFRDFTLEQGENFRRILALLGRGGVKTEACLANSAGILGFPELSFDAQRPGISLYGSNPFRNTPLAHTGAGLEPAMEVTAPIISVKYLKKGESVSYGRTYIAENDLRVAVVACGYADNFSRGLSGKGFMCVRGKRAPILGRVCMQLIMLDVSEIAHVSLGDEVFVLGGEGEAAITPDELADVWGTISYEVLCLLGQNRREYIE